MHSLSVPFTLLYLPKLLKSWRFPVRLDAFEGLWIDISIKTLRTPFPLYWFSFTLVFQKMSSIWDFIESLLLLIVPEKTKKILKRILFIVVLWLVFLYIILEALVVEGGGLMNQESTLAPRTLVKVWFYFSQKIPMQTGCNWTRIDRGTLRACYNLIRSCHW